MQFVALIAAIVGIIGLFALTLGAMWLSFKVRDVRRKRQDYKSLHDVAPGLIEARYLAWKERYCPLVKIEGQEPDEEDDGEYDPA